MRPIRSSPARSSARIGSETPGMRSSGSTLSGSTNCRSAAMKPNAFSASRAARVGHRIDAVARLGRLDRGQDQAELAVAPLGVGGQAVVALGQLGQDVVARRPGSAGSGRRPRRATTAAEISRSGATRSSPIAAPPRMPTATATANMNSSSRAPTCGSTAPVAMQQTRPKIAERDDRRGQEGQGQPRLERQATRAGRGSRVGVVPIGVVPAAAAVAARSSPVVATSR